MKPLQLIPYNCGWGASDRGCADGPATLKKRGLEAQLIKEGLKAHWAEFLHSSLEPKNDEAPQGVFSLPLVEDYCTLLHGQVKEALENRKFPIPLGGDHSMAIGTWSAVADYHKCHGKLGLIWVDAHMDAHRPETSPSQAYHGMPAAVLLGQGESALKSISSRAPVILPHHLVFIGIRSYEEGEHDLLRKLGVKLYMMPEIRERGLDAVMSEALGIVTKGTKGFGITIDLDAFDPSRAPGVGSPEKDGLLRKETFTALTGLGKRTDCFGLEIAEYNPHHGKGGVTTALVRDLILSVMR